MGLAGLEFSIGLLISIMFKNLNFSIFFYFNETNSNRLLENLIKKKNNFYFENIYI